MFDHLKYSNNFSIFHLFAKEKNLQSKIQGLEQHLCEPPSCQWRQNWTRGVWTSCYWSMLRWRRSPDSKCSDQVTQLWNDSMIRSAIVHPGIFMPHIFDTNLKFLFIVSYCLFKYFCFHRWFYSSGDSAEGCAINEGRAFCVLHKQVTYSLSHIIFVTDITNHISLIVLK